MNVGTGLKSTPASLLPAAVQPGLPVLTSLSVLAKVRVQTLLVQIVLEQLGFLFLHAF